ncbi:MAG TPA: glutamate cyclase domain-containing protein [Rhodopila sp.]|uniref:glutamate cyclase domain-containing protein n=1 Tax=Rhodopila sp. TaxID=2480087 RepID=UPI002BD314B2|nr:glutamate cyclase domain-containing protein [Rhodopila sp.]HVY16656.1 glutamate cyclase domain-containing protein [Rhodopila sp.]
MSDLIDRIEAELHRDVGRGMDAVFAATKGGLRGAAAALARARGVGIITGFFVPGATPPAAETDGPAGAALLARAFFDAGVTCRVATDTICAQACTVALHAAGVGSVPVDGVAPGGDATQVIAAWRDAGIDVALAIERCGPAADGIPRNMRGRDLTDYVAPLDRLFTAGPWRTVAIGDGGNEIGMGAVPPALIAEHVPLGETVGCVVPAEHLVSAGVSHWGAYGVLAALSVLRPDWRHVRGLLDPGLDAAIVAAMVADGPAVDGVTLSRVATIDSRDMATHHTVLAAITTLLG